MDKNFEKSLELVLEQEGGSSDDPRDPGGATMYGITLATYQSHYGNDKTKHDLRNITHTELEHIYRGYWRACRCGELKPGNDYAMFDSAVNSGPVQAIRWLQRVLGTSEDGRFGPITFRRLDSITEFDLSVGVCEARLDFLSRLPSWDNFGKGWAKRVQFVQARAISMTIDQA